MESETLPCLSHALRLTQGPCHVSENHVEVSGTLWHSLILSDCLTTFVPQSPDSDSAHSNYGVQYLQLGSVPGLSRAWFCELGLY